MREKIWSPQMRQMGRIGRPNVTLCNLRDNIVLTPSSWHTHELRNISKRQSLSPSSEVSSSEVMASQNHHIVPWFLQNYKCLHFLSWHSCLIVPFCLFLFFFLFWSPNNSVKLSLIKIVREYCLLVMFVFPSLLLRQFFSLWFLEVSLWWA